MVALPALFVLGQVLFSEEGAEVAGCESAGDAAAGMPGTLDPSFSGGGYVHASYGGGALWIHALREVFGGKVVASASTWSSLGPGRIVNQRFLGDGTPDISFHGTGAAFYGPHQYSGFDAEIHGIDRGDDGALLFVGWARPRRAGVGPKRNYDIVLLRYCDDGTPDGAFGDSGVGLVDLGGEEHVRAVAFHRGEKAVFVAGDRDGKPFVAKLLERDGRLDTQGFATPRGWMSLDLGNAAPELRGMALDAEGRIVLAGSAEADGHPEVVVVRMGPSGGLDPTFGVGGVVRLARPGGQRACAVVALPDGRVVIAGDTGDQRDFPDRAATRSFLLVRLLLSGALDPSFGEGGVALAPLGRPRAELSSAIALTRVQDGRLLVGGTGSLAGADGPVIARFLPNGSLDPTFGAGGEARFVVETGPGWRPSGGRGGGATETTLQTISLTLDERRLLVAGTWSAYSFQGYVARLWN